MKYAIALAFTPQCPPELNQGPGPGKGGLTDQRQRPATSRTTPVLGQLEGAPGSSELPARQPVPPTAWQEPKRLGLRTPFHCRRLKVCPR